MPLGRGERWSRSGRKKPGKRQGGKSYAAGTLYESGPWRCITRAALQLMGDGGVYLPQLNATAVTVVCGGANRPRFVPTIQEH
jgi:hypothetical protein